MGMQLNTGDTGRTVLASADGSLYSKIFGNGCYVLEGGSEFEAEVESNNLIKISDGDLIMQGRHSYIPASDSEEVTINNGTQGMNRKDLIVARYTKSTVGVEDVTLEVIEGEETSGTAVAPEYVDGDILNGATQKDFPLYEVSITGISITACKQLFTVLTSMSMIESRTEAVEKKTSDMTRVTVFYRDSTCAELSLSTTYKTMEIAKRSSTGQEFKISSGKYVLPTKSNGETGSGRALVSGQVKVTNATKGDIISARIVTFNSSESFTNLIQSSTTEADSSGTAYVVIPPCVSVTLSSNSILGVQVCNNTASRGKIASGTNVSVGLTVQNLTIP